jgi:hypothetical protein
VGSYLPRAEPRDPPAAQSRHVHRRRLVRKLEAQECKTKAPADGAEGKKVGGQTGRQAGRYMGT